MKCRPSGRDRPDPMLTVVSRGRLEFAPRLPYNPALSVAGKPNAGARLGSPNETIRLMPLAVKVSTTRGWVRVRSAHPQVEGEPERPPLANKAARLREPPAGVAVHHRLGDAEAVNNCRCYPVRLVRGRPSTPHRAPQDLPPRPSPASRTWSGRPQRRGRARARLPPARPCLQRRRACHRP